jgi:hypothetical protein
MFRVPHPHCSNSLTHSLISLLPLSLPAGDDASLECLAESVPKPNLTWVRNGQVVTNGTLLSFGRQIYMIHEKSYHDSNEKSSKLIISNSMAKDAGL